ncbi:MAG: hypothetical protein J6A57_04220 [Ruminococcus sp.]|nr:hypothetical protein [Ruminococcus sp.]
MKKYISAVIASAMVISSLSAVTASAESYGDGNIDIMVLGDSVASGNGLAETEYNYGQLVADYLGGDVWNYAVSGYESAETLAQIRSFDSSQKAQLADSEVVVISIGGNDMMSYMAESMLDFAAKNNLLAEGKTPDDIPEEKNFGTLSELIDMEAVKEYTADLSNAIRFSDKLDSIYKNIAYTDANNNGAAYVQIIAKQVIPNIKAMVEEIKAVNPDARVIVQNVYNPLQFSKEYEASLKDRISGSYFTAYQKLNTIFGNTTRKFSEQLNDVEGIEVADVLADFSSEDASGEKYGWYFTKMQAGRENMDIHPTQAGHVAIASTVLNTIGETREDGGLLAMTFNGLKDVENYPAHALSQYNKLAGSYCMGDVNDDGFINSADASLVLEQYALLSTGKAATVTENQLKAGRINEDNTVDSSDASAILGYYAFTSTGGNGSIKYYMANQ